MAIFVRFVALALFATLFVAPGCQDGPPSAPRPRGYPKVVYPPKAYQAFDENFCAFTFEYPTYTEIQQDTAFWDQAPLHPCWFDLYYPDFDGRVYFSYHPLNTGSGKDLNELITDAFELVDWHNKRANYIDEIRIQRPEARVSGLAFDITGPAASPFQFFLTDSTRHFLRGALYFNTQARPDSLAPITTFVKEDIVHLLETFRWRE